MNIVRLIATHCHVDLIAGANSAIEKLNLPLEISPLGKDLLGKVGPIALLLEIQFQKLKKAVILRRVMMLKSAIIPLIFYIALDTVLILSVFTPIKSLLVETLFLEVAWEELIYLEEIRRN